MVREAVVAFIQFQRIFSYYYFRGLIFCSSTNRFWFASGITETLASQILYSLAEVPFTCLNKSPFSTFCHNQILLKALLPLPGLSTNMMSSYFFLPYGNWWYCEILCFLFALFFFICPDPPIDLIRKLKAFLRIKAGPGACTGQILGDIKPKLPKIQMNLDGAA